MLSSCTENKSHCDLMRPVKGKFGQLRTAVYRLNSKNVIVPHLIKRKNHRKKIKTKKNRQENSKSRVKRTKKKSGESYNEKTNESTSTSCNISFVRTRLKGWFRLRLSRMSDVVAGGELDRIRFVISSVSSVTGARFNSWRYWSVHTGGMVFVTNPIGALDNRLKCYLSISSTFQCHQVQPMKSSTAAAELFSSENVEPCHYKIALSFQTILPSTVHQQWVDLKCKLELTRIIQPKVKLKGSLSSLVKLSTWSLCSLSGFCFSAQMTSVMMYRIDKMILKSVESASDTVILRVATEAVTVFLFTCKTMKLNLWTTKPDGDITHSISRLNNSTIAENTPNRYIIMTLVRVHTCCSWSDWTSKKHP